MLVLSLLSAALSASPPALAADDDAAALNALVSARLAEEAGDPGAALAALTRLASEVPALPGLRARMLEQAIEAGDLAAARSAATRLWTAGDRRFDAQLVLIVDAMRRSDWKDARDFLQARGDKTGGDAVTRLIQPVMAAWIDVAMREDAPERHLIAASSRLRPEPALALEAAIVQLAAKRPDDAVALTDRTILTDRTSQLVALRLAATLESVGEKEAAKRLRGRVLLAAGSREDPMLLLPDQPVTNARAGVGHWLGLLADGFARAPNANPRIPLLFARAGAWLSEDDWAVRSALVEALDGNGQPRAATALLAEIRGPVPPVLIMRRAELIADAGALEEATKLAETAASGEPPARSLLVRFADIARRSGDRDAADRAYARLEASLGDDAEDDALRGSLLIARAELLLQADRWDAAQPLMERAVALRPNDAAILNFVGYSALERRRDVDRSLQRIEAAWRVEPQSPAITDSLGWAYFLTGRIDDAVPLLERAQRGDPENAVIAEHLGDAYWKTGRQFQARYLWRAASLTADADMTTRLDAKLRDGLTSSTTAP